MRFFIIVILLSIIQTSLAQGQGEGKGQKQSSVKDSLSEVWKNSVLPIAERAEAGRWLARMLKNNSPAQAITLLEEVEALVGNNRSEADLETYMLMSGAYRTQGNYVMALETAQQALTLAEQLENDLGIANAYTSIGQTYERQEDFEKSIRYHHKALDINLAMGKAQRVGMCYSNIGNINGQMMRLSEALSSYELSLTYLNKAKDEDGIARVHGNMGYVYSIQGDSIIENGGSKEEARTYYLISIDKSQKAKNHFEITGNLQFALNARNNIALVYNSMDEFHIAEKMCLSTLAESITQGIVPLERDACECLYKAYKGKGQQNLALKYYERFNYLKDSLLNMDEQRRMLEQELNYNYEKQSQLSEELHNQELNTQKQLAQKDSYRRNIIIAAVTCGLIILIVFSAFLYNRFKIIRKQNDLINAQKEDLEFQKELVDIKNSEITDSIVYARRFQSAILPSEKEFFNHFPESFILYKPKDIVAGDFYWMEKVEGKIIFAAADCTGHGVPGAMVSIVCNNALNRAVREYSLSEPGAILDKTRELILEEFSKDGEEVKDGMDIAICSIKKGYSASTLKYAGAHNPLWIIRKGSTELLEIKANKQPIGHFDNLAPFTTHEIQLKQGDQIYLTSDGYADQFGGDKGKKFKAANFKKLLLSIQHLSMPEQQKQLDEAFENWRGSLEQLDDVCVIGVKI